MGHIFDLKTAKLFEAWQHSPEGISLDKSSSELIVRLLRPQRGERVLDIGCGAGNHLLMFHRLGLDVTGIDASPCMLDIAQSRLGTKASLRIGRAEDLPFEDNEFDLATLIFTLEFLDDPCAALQEAGRVTKDRIFIGILNPLSFQCMCKKIAALFHDSVFRQAHLLTLWGLKSSAKKAYGNVPMEWGSVQMMPSFFRNYAESIRMSSMGPSCPFGAFIGLAVEITYTFKTENIDATERLKKGTKSLIKSPGF